MEALDLFEPYITQNSGLMDPELLSLQALVQNIYAQRGDFPRCYPDVDPFDLYRVHISTLLSQIIGISAQTIYHLLQKSLSHESCGLVLNVKSLKITDEKPQALAERWSEHFPYSCLIESPKIPIYSSSSLLFIFKPVPLSNILIPSILAEKVIWGYNSSLGLKDTQDNSKSRKRIIIHSSVAQVSQSSHLRSIILGNFFANLYEKSGWDVVRLKDASERWGKRYEETYARFNFRFDDEHRPTESSVRDILQLLQSKNFATLEMDGALTIDFSVHVPGRVGKELEKSVLRSSDGTNTRLLNDLAALLERHQSYRFEKMLYVAGKDQDLHYKQLLKLVELLRYEELRSRVSHVNFGPVLGLENFSSFDEIMDDITQNLHDNLKKEEAKHSNLSEQDRIVEKLATSAILIQDLSARRTAPYTFNTHASASLISSTGPFLHLSYARLCSAITSLTTNIYPEITPLTLDHTTPHAQTLLSHLVHFPSVLALTLKTHEPSVLVTYLMRFTHAINASYEELEKQEVGARRGLLEAVRNVILGGMEVLGCRPDGKDDNSKVSQESIMD